MSDDWGGTFFELEQMPIEDNDPRKADHELLHAFQRGTRYSDGGLSRNALFEKMQQLPPSRCVDLIETAQVRIQYASLRPINYAVPGGLDSYRSTIPLRTLISKFLSQSLAWEPQDMERLMTLAVEAPDDVYGVGFPIEELPRQIEAFCHQPELMKKWRPLICGLRQKLSSKFVANVTPEYLYGSNTAMRQFADLLGTQLEDFLERGDAWADCAIADLEAMEGADRVLWLSLFDYARQSKDSKAKEKWLKGADAHLQLIGQKAFLDRIKVWFPLFGKDDGWWFADREERNDAYFKGLVWMSSRIEDTAVISALGAALRGSFKARGRAGVRAQKVGNACIWTLGRRDETEAAAHLVNAKNRVKNGAVLKTLDKAIEIVALRAQMTSADLEELAVPDYGLENGCLTRQFEKVSVQVEISSGKAIWRWENEGKAVKSVPAQTKRDHASELKELKAVVAEIEKTFVAQKERLDALLRAGKSWDFATWKTRYLDHPLMQLLTQRLLWNFDSNGRKVVALPREGKFFKADGEEITLMDADVPTAVGFTDEVRVSEVRVSLYHPLFDTPESIMQWRRFFEEGSLKQPFKQAHREIYLLTDAERVTRTYSNRFASHILKQHQFNSLCTARGWKNTLRLLVDDEYPPAVKVWPEHNLRAEFWIEGIGGNYGTDTTEAGSYLRLTTDQVRFYPVNAPMNTAHAGGGGYSVGYNQPPPEAMPLEQVPPLVFSETMRDIDLFVGVASLGADPNWNDGEPNAHFRHYWSEYSWGELSENAKSRADVLSRLLPRLKIKDKTKVEGRFLRVEGHKRVYKVHLGSGNILMEPNDQYLCIVPSRGEQDEVLLPFEGDRTLSVILSKAFLLVDDDKIKDPSIVRQIYT